MSTSPINAVSGSLVHKIPDVYTQSAVSLSPDVIRVPAVGQAEDTSSLSHYARAAAALHTAAQAAAKDGNEILSRQLEQLFVEFTKIAQETRLPKEEPPAPER
jgi:hypothetical protein